MSDQKKDKLNAGMTKPEKERPTKEKLVILNPGTNNVTKNKVTTLTTQRKAPRVNKLTGKSNKFSSGLIRRLKILR